MHTWTVTCDPAVAQDSGTAATEVDAVLAGAAALRRIASATHRTGRPSPYLCLHIDIRFRIGLSAGSGGPDRVLEWIDDYEHQATLAAAVDDCVPGRGGPRPGVLTQP
ncbi:hypothetical protein QLG13_28155 (plasmid) [Rhodococcus aetherivorans]|uniref:hypothetical protein n=1 Tax=Rhodococcus aetherivorans TaxID=191292 RepID=UPI0002D226B5|nr:hypothetical protein [Rhodococcus aetherivorans]CCW10612.1 hypothetical protein EBESD8_11430 [Rhodococcus aetherivorans]